MRHNRTSIINTALMRVGGQGVTAAFQDSPSAQTAAAAWPEARKARRRVGVTPGPCPPTACGW